MKITETVQKIIPEHIGKNNIKFNKPYQEILVVEHKQVNKISTANMGQFSHSAFLLGPLGHRVALSQVLLVKYGLNIEPDELYLKLGQLIIVYFSVNNGPTLF